MKHKENKQIKLQISILVFLLTGFLLPETQAKCEGNFVNPMTDICWDCFFPITIGSINVVSGDYPDTENPKVPIEVCKMNFPPYERIGLNIGFWEPFALTDVTPEPYCLVNMGGISMPNVMNSGHGGKQIRDADDSAAFYYVHWYKYPLMFLLNIITSIGCVQGGDFDLAWITEVDPTWNDDEYAFVLNPEAVLFGNPIAQVACAADAIKAQVDLPIDKLFWCAGTQGSMYPFTGRVFDEKSPIQSAVLLSERMDFKLHRQMQIQDSSPDAGENVGAIGFYGPICTQHFAPIMPKSRYRYQLTNTIPNAEKCYQFGHDTITWEGGHNKPDSGDAYGFFIWRKKNCTFL